MNRDSQSCRTHLVGHVDGQWSLCVPNSIRGRGGAGGMGAREQRGWGGGEGQGGMGVCVTPLKARALLGSVNICPQNSFWPPPLTKRLGWSWAVLINARQAVSSWPWLLGWPSGAAWSEERRTWRPARCCSWCLGWSWRFPSPSWLSLPAAPAPSPAPAHTWRWSVSCDAVLGTSSMCLFSLQKLISSLVCNSKGQEGDRLSPIILTTCWVSTRLAVHWPWRWWSLLHSAILCSQADSPSCYCVCFSM